MARSTATTPPPETLRTRAMEVHERLCREYGAPIPFFHDVDLHHHADLSVSDPYEDEAPAR